MFYVAISFQPLRAARHCTHSVRLLCLPDGLRSRPLSAYCMVLFQNKHLLTLLGICIVYTFQRSRLHLIEAELKTRAQVKARERLSCNCKVTGLILATSDVAKGNELTEAANRHEIQ